MFEFPHRRSAQDLPPPVTANGPRPQSADSWGSWARLGLEPTRPPNLSPRPSPKPDFVFPLSPKPNQVPPCPGSPARPRPRTGPSARPAPIQTRTRPPTAIVASTKGRVSSSRDFRGAPRPPPASLRGDASGSFGQGRGAHLSLLWPPRLCRLMRGMVRLAWTVALGLFPSFSLAKQWLLRIRCREDFTIRPLGSETRKTSAAPLPRRRRCSPFAKWRLRSRPLL